MLQPDWGRSGISLARLIKAVSEENQARHIPAAAPCAPVLPLSQSKNPYYLVGVIYGVLLWADMNGGAL